MVSFCYLSKAVHLPNRSSTGTVYISAIRIDRFGVGMTPTQRSTYIFQTLMTMKRICSIWLYRIVSNPRRRQHYTYDWWVNKNMGLCFQKKNVNQQKTSVCRRAGNHHLKNTHSLKSFLPQEALVILVYVFVTFHREYCNSLLYGISGHNIDRTSANL